MEEKHGRNNRPNFIIDIVNNFLEVKMDYDPEEVRDLNIVKIEPLPDKSDVMFPSSLVITFLHTKDAEELIDKFYRNKRLYSRSVQKKKKDSEELEWVPTVNIKLSCPDEFQDRYTRFIDRARKFAIKKFL